MNTCQKIKVIKRKIKKKIKLGKYKPLKFKNIMLLQELEKSNTFRKTQKYLDED